MQFTVYIIKSDLGHYYIGQTIDFNDRLKKHNQGSSKFTKNKGRWELVTAVKVNSRSEAVKLESKLKIMKNSKKAIEYLNNLVQNIPI
jgi:putative endonuclease